MSKLQEHIKEIKETKSGYERNMYPSIKSIFESLGHKSKNIIVDSGSELGQGIPDLVIKTEVGTKEKGKPILGDWVVCEVKDERTAFKTPGSRNKILKDKEKYITLDTNYFIMIDPERMVIRPVTVGSSLNYDSSKDIVIEWEEALKHNDQWFKEQTASIAADKSSIKVALDKFRTGDTSSIAVISLKPQDTTKAEQKRAEKAKQEFFHAIKRATILLQSATKEALEDVQPKIEEILKAIDDFEEKYDGVKKLSLEPFELQGQVIGYERALEHDEDVERIKEKVMSNISIAKLALVWLPEFRSRIGKKKEEVIQELFAIETANMILARILLLRFFEDHGFFGEKRYLCNGGIKAFQMMREYFELTYMKLLKDVYEKAKTIYYSVFEEMELDWVLGSENERLSQAIELSLMHFSKFDFTTIRGDILTGIYDRFLEGSQRKKLGEYYTKPSVARYIIDRIEIDRDDVVLDPACGSGTFLLEVFNKTIGEHIDAGVVTYEEAVSFLGLLTVVRLP
ncbi:N-6 DNA methylase [Nitrosophilus labii]|uniref:N-6 DNA methylase n=1 Tax=Nitrosophilus labii TaxID=2706014 RepID=UPI001656EEF6|nr:N-6 DNA methylase [Nitrosophilus labii]